MGDENLNIIDNIGVLVLKALNKAIVNGRENRSVACKTLGISKRTLERYIKMYSLGYDTINIQWRKKEKHEIRRERNTKGYSSYC